MEVDEICALLALNLVLFGVGFAMVAMLGDRRWQIYFGALLVIFGALMNTSLLS